MKLSDYQITVRRVLYDREDIWLKTPEQIARWKKYCADNAATRLAQFAEGNVADFPLTRVGKQARRN
jgi:hypothetical protein